MKNSRAYFLFYLEGTEPQVDIIGEIVGILMYGPKNQTETFWEETTII